MRPGLIVSFALLALVLPPSALAQDTGRLAGRVLDYAGAPLPGVAIDLVIDTREWTTTTGSNGDYHFDGLPLGTAELTYRLLNFNVLRRLVTLTLDASASVDVVLTLAFSADVIVTGRTTFRSLADVVNPAESLVGIASAARACSSERDRISPTKATSRPPVRPT